MEMINVFLSYRRMEWRVI